MVDVRLCWLCLCLKQERGGFLRAFVKYEGSLFLEVFKIEWTTYTAKGLKAGLESLVLLLGNEVRN